MHKAELFQADILKTEILRQYKSIRQFSLEMELPYSTLATALERGVDGMAYGTVIRICEKLKINPMDFAPLNEKEPLSKTIMENELMSYYFKLNPKGKERALSCLEDLCEIKKYCDQESIG